jgi:alanyl aminopeptidase
MSMRTTSLRSFGIVLLHRLIPLFLSALQQRVAIFRQNIFLLDHFIHRVAVTLEIFLAVGVSLCNASAWIGVFLALSRRFCEGDVRCFKRDALIGCTNRRVTQVPTGIGGEWHRELRRTALKRSNCGSAKLIYFLPMPVRCLSKAGMLLALVFLVSTCGLTAAQQPVPEFRLPEGSRPTHYQLDLTIVPSEPTFQGNEVISVELKERSEVVWLNAKDLTIQQVKVNTGGVSKAVRWHAAGEFLGVDFPEAMGPGRMQIEIRYEGKLDDKSNVGAYRKKSGNDWYVYTSFTPIDARRAFPCFDEPGYKAPWRVTLHVKRDQVALANAPAVAESNEPEDMKRVSFAPTQPLASEVVAFAVGPFEVVDAGVAGQKRVPVRIITPRGRASEAEAARTATPEIMARLEHYTGIPYPWDKLDHLAVLDMPFGATENPGLITYRDRVLLAPPDRDTQRRQRSMRETMAHEVAHQWFGNLVTQAWWDDVWLSEGFATWLGTKISDMERPPFERGLVITQMRNRRLSADSPGTRPVRLEMHSRQEADDVYNGVVYTKGAAILEMLEDWIGPEPFQRSLHRYLTDHQFSSGTSADLARAIKQESGVDAAPVLFAFLDRPGAPLLRFNLVSDSGGAKLEIEQGDHPWPVPVCFHVADSGRRCEVLNNPQAEVRLDGMPVWIWPNAYGSGYYRSQLTANLLEGLVEKGYSQLEEKERLSLAGDLESLTGSGVPATEVLKVLPMFAQSQEGEVTAHAAAIALALATAAPDDVRGKYAAWLKKTMGLTLMTPEQARSMEEFFRDKP